MSISEEKEMKEKEMKEEEKVFYFIGVKDDKILMKKYFNSLGIKVLSKQQGSYFVVCDHLENLKKAKEGHDNIHSIYPGCSYTSSLFSLSHE